MNLGEPPCCIMIKLFPGMAKKMASKLMTKFQLDGSSFLNTESKRETLDPVWMSAMCGCLQCVDVVCSLCQIAVRGTGCCGLDRISILGLWSVSMR